MEQPIAVFEPIRTGNYYNFIISLVVAFIALVFLLFNLKKKGTPTRKGYRQLFSLLSFFVLIIAVVTAFFSFWAAQKFTPVKVFQDAIETGYGNADFNNIVKVYIHNDQQKSRLTRELEGEITRILIIEESDRKTHALSEENYQIDSLFSVLRRLKDIKYSN